MAEQIALEYDSDVQLCPKNNLIEVDFRPIMQRIGEKGATGWNIELNADVISSEPLGDPEEYDDMVSVKFLQYHRDYAHSEEGIDHSRGWTGPETIRILVVTWRAETNAIHTSYIHSRNFRYHLPGHESRRHTPNAILADIALRQELWDGTFSR